MIERYSREEVKKIWQDHNRYKIWLDIELAAALAMEKYKLIPIRKTSRYKCQGGNN